LRLERASVAHQTAVSSFNEWLEDRGFTTTELDYDILAKRSDVWLLTEVKTIETASPRSQTMRAIGQLAYYRSLSIPEPPEGVSLIRVVLFDKDPNDQSLSKVLREELIEEAWLEKRQPRFRSSNFEDLLTRD
jgi:hypothetical protein